MLSLPEVQVDFFDEAHCRSFLKANPYRLMVMSCGEKNRAVRESVQQLGFDANDLLARVWREYSCYGTT